MRNKLLFIMLCVFFTLGACTKTSAPQQKSEPITNPTNPIPTDPIVLGLIEVTFTALGSEDFEVSAVSLDPSLVLDTQALTHIVRSASGVEIEQVSKGFFEDDQFRYYSVIFDVRNGTGSDQSNITFLPLGTGIADTLAAWIFRPDGSNYSDNTTLRDDIAKSIKPTHGMTYEGPNGLVVQQTNADFQAFAEADIASLITSLGSNILPYGFVARNKADTTNRILPSSAADIFTGAVSMAVKFPRQASASDDPFRVGARFVIVADSITKVTESLEEQGSSQAETRADALNPDAEVVILGTSTTTVTGNTLTRLCSVRTAGTSASPTTFLVNETTGVCDPLEVQTNTQAALQTAIDNATDGDTITFASSITGQSIPITTPVVLGKNITFNATSPTSAGTNVTIMSSTTHLFEMTDADVAFVGVNFSGGLNPIPQEGDIFDILDVTGSLSVSDSTISSYADTGMSVNNLNGDDFDLTLDDVTVNATSSTGEVIFVEAINGSADVFITNSTFNGGGACAVEVIADGSNTSRIKVDATAISSSASEAVCLESFGTATLEARLLNSSSFIAGTTVNNDAVTMLADENASLQAFVDSVTLTPNGTRAGIYSEAADAASLDLTFTNSSQSNTTDEGILFFFNDVDGNACADVRTNTSSSTVPVTLEQDSANDFELPGLTTTATALLDGQNTFTGSTTLGSGGFTNGTCTLPSTF